MDSAPKMQLDEHVPGESRTTERMSFPLEQARQNVSYRARKSKSLGDGLLRKHEGSNACAANKDVMVPGMIYRRYKVHGEWRIFRWLCKENNRTQKKANGVSDLEDDGERKEFCRETEGRGRQISKRRGSDDEGSSLRNQS